MTNVSKIKKKKLKKRLKKKVKIILLILVMIISLLLIIIFSIKDKNFATKNSDHQSNKISLEEKFYDLVEDYYINILKDKIVNVNRYIITLKTLENAGYDIKDLKQAETSKVCDDENTYAIIEITSSSKLSIGAEYKIDVKIDC